MQLEIRSQKKAEKVSVNMGDNLLNVLTDRGYDVNSVCGGNGSCFKCKVKMLYPQIKPTEREIKNLSSEEVESGIRLACGVVLNENTGVEIISAGKINVLQPAKGKTVNKSGKIRAVADIGTTTVVCALIGESNEIIGTAGEKNRQAVYGADVISRIKYVINGGLPELHRVLIEQIGSLLVELMRTHGVKTLEDLTVAGNTTMMHLFFNRDCSGMGFAPYTADFLSSQTAKGKDLGLDLDITVRSLPCIAAFAGADLIAGIVSECRDSEKYTLLIDLGTNAELALFNSKQFLVSSAAAGPAFEGAGIKQGMAAIPGAISSFELLGGFGRIKTIGNEVPVGICGSGLIDVVAELLNNNMIDETGLLKTGPSYEIYDDVSIYAEDIREIQLAKAAIASAIDILIVTSGLKESGIERVLISGGFGSFINARNAAGIGLIPHELHKRTAAAGNTCLTGTILCSANPDKMALAEKIAATANYVDLAGSTEFAQRYVDNIMF